MTRDTFEAKASQRFDWELPNGSGLTFDKGELDVETERPHYFTMDKTETRQLYEAMKAYYEDV